MSFWGAARPAKREGIAVGGKPLGRVIDRIATEGELLMVADAALGFMDIDPPVAAGGCAPVEPRASEYALTSAVCASAGGTPDAAERANKTGEVIEGTNSQCAIPQWFFPMELSALRHLAGFCMSQAE